MILQMRPTEIATYCWSSLEDATEDLGDMSAMEAFDRFLNWHRDQRNP